LNRASTPDPAVFPPPWTQTITGTGEVRGHFGVHTFSCRHQEHDVRAAHAAFWNYANCFILPYVDENDRYLNALPMFHTAGTGITYSMLRAGMRI
jgi:hypothetical protein